MAEHDDEPRDGGDAGLPEGACGPSEAPEGGEAESSRRASVGVSEAPRATGEERALRPDAGSEESGADPAGEARHLASAELKAILEALIFASPEPLTPAATFKLLAAEPREDVEIALADLKRDYENRGGLQLVEVAGGLQIVTRPDLHEWVRRLFHERAAQRLTVQALETLAVIAYKQPITALEVAEIRGVNTSTTMTTLLERHLIRIIGRKQVVGRPFLYSTTKDFLIRFGLNDLSDLPKVEDVAEALGFEPPALLTERTPAEEMLPLEEPDESVPPDDEPSGAVH